MQVLNSCVTNVTLRSWIKLFKFFTWKIILNHHTTHRMRLCEKKIVLKYDNLWLQDDECLSLENNALFLERMMLRLLLFSLRELSTPWYQTARRWLLLSVRLALNGENVDLGVPRHHQHRRRRGRVYLIRNRSQGFLSTRLSWAHTHNYYAPVPRFIDLTVVVIYNYDRFSIALGTIITGNFWPLTPRLL